MRAIVVVAALAACAPKPRPEPEPMANTAPHDAGPSPRSPEEIVHRTLTALGEGDSRAVLEGMPTTRELEQYIACVEDAQGRPAHVRWRMLELFRQGEVEAAAEKLQAYGLALDDYAIQYGEVTDVLVGDDDSESCRVIQAYSTLEVDVSFYVERDDGRMTLTLDRLGEPWRLGYLRYGRGYNN